MERNDLASFDVHRQSNPLLVFFLVHEAGHCIGFDLKTLDHHIVVIRDRLPMQMIGQRVKAGHEKA